MPYCTNCGAEVGITAKFCPACGFERGAGDSKTSEVEKKSSCPSCGSSDKLRWSALNKSWICDNCGHSFDTSNGTSKKELVTKHGNRKLRYEDVHWNRKSWFNGLLAFFGLVGLSPLLWWCCINLITGDVYYSGYDEYGNLRKWSKANKVIAFVLLAINILWILLVIVSIIAS